MQQLLLDHPVNPSDKKKTFVIKSVKCYKKLVKLFFGKF